MSMEFDPLELCIRSTPDLTVNYYVLLLIIQLDPH